MSEDGAATRTLTAEQRVLNDLWEGHVRHEFETRDTEASSGLW
jgi:hypothetical protein